MKDFLRIANILSITLKNRRAHLTFIKNTASILTISHFYLTIKAIFYIKLKFKYIKLLKKNYHL